MKSIIVTGAGSGLGKELSLLLSKKNYHLLLAGRNHEKLLMVKNEIEKAGGKADVMTVDIRSKKDIDQSISQLSKEYQIYGLVNNAGVGYFGPFEKMTQEEISEMIETNLTGTILMTQSVLAKMKNYGEGHMINIISTAGLRGKINEAVYAASKFAIRGLTESLQKEYEGTNIKFTAVYMGGMDTPFWEGSDHIKDKSRLRSPKEVAELIINEMEKETIIIESNKKS
jgi:short-subunit dehydrogenase